MRSFAQILRARRARVLAIVLLGLLSAPALAATDPATFSYWVSMRGAQDAQPSYVAAAYNSSGSYATAFTGCADHTYYLTSSDASTVQAALSAGRTVQVHRGPVGSSQPSQASVICLVQAAQ